MAGVNRWILPDGVEEVLLFNQEHDLVSEKPK